MFYFVSLIQVHRGLYLPSPPRPRPGRRCAAAQKAPHHVQEVGGAFDLNPKIYLAQLLQNLFQRQSVSQSVSQHRGQIQDPHKKERKKKKKEKRKK